jgi:hypothetical protein
MKTAPVRRNVATSAANRIEIVQASGARGYLESFAHCAQAAVSVKDRHPAEGFPTILSYRPSGHEVGSSRKNRSSLPDGQIGPHSRFI